jgi:hypothetical protein
MDQTDMDESLAINFPLQTQLAKSSPLPWVFQPKDPDLPREDHKKPARLRRNPRNGDQSQIESIDPWHPWVLSRPQPSDFPEKRHLIPVRLCRNHWNSTGPKPKESVVSVFGPRESDTRMSTHQLFTWARVDGRISLGRPLPKGTVVNLVLNGAKSECRIVRGFSPKDEVIRGV